MLDIELRGLVLRSQVSTFNHHLAVSLCHNINGFLHRSHTGLQAGFDLQLGLPFTKWDCTQRILVRLDQCIPSAFPVQNSTHHCLCFRFLPGYASRATTYNSSDCLFLLLVLQFSFPCHLSIDNIISGKSILWAIDFGSYAVSLCKLEFNSLLSNQ